MTIIMPKSMTKTVRFKTMISAGSGQFACLDEEGQLWLGALDLTDMSSQTPMIWYRSNMPQAFVDQTQSALNNLDVEVE